MSMKGMLSNSRIMLSLVPGLGSLILLRMAIHWYRPDLEDAEYRVRDYPFEKLHDCYDFIVVGAGSAGAVVASRLTENPEWSVLLLEAGSDENVLSEIPVTFPILQSSAIDWRFTTEPNKGYCQSMVDERCLWPRGKVLGGSSVLNAMLYIRGNRRDYDKWAKMGNTGWSYSEVLPYFLKSEDMRIPAYLNDPYHATGGPLTVEYFKYQEKITAHILKAGEELGYPIRDVNGEMQTGFTRSHATVRDGLRCSTAKAFLRPAAKRPNLHVSIYSHVEKILFDEHKRAIGVQFKKNDQQRIVRCNKEVILSAGAIQSPQVLMLSGIGDEEHLKQIGIYPIHHAPGVGQNLQDHVAMGGHSFLFDNPSKTNEAYSFNILKAMSIGSLLDFIMHKKGELYCMPEAEAMAFVKTKYADPNDDYPDIQLFIAPTADNLDGGLYGKRANGLTDDTYAELYENILWEPSYSVVPLLLRPKSRGYIKLKDADPYTYPLIYPNYYADPQDVKVMIEGARIANELAKMPALKGLNARPNPNRNPGCAHHPIMSDEHLECQARHHTLTIYHPSGTCAMGPAHDPGAVVDPRLRVYGVKNLRVVDASVIPAITNGNTNAPTIMIGEKASDMIKQDWSEQHSPGYCDKHQYRTNDEQTDDMEQLAQKLFNHDLINETFHIFPNLQSEVFTQLKEMQSLKFNPFTSPVKARHKEISIVDDEIVYSSLADMNRPFGSLQYDLNPLMFPLGIDYDKTPYSIHQKTQSILNKIPNQATMPISSYINSDGNINPYLDNLLQAQIPFHVPHTANYNEAPAKVHSKQQDNHPSYGLSGYIQNQNPNKVQQTMANVIVNGMHIFSQEYRPQDISSVSAPLSVPIGNQVITPESDVNYLPYYNPYTPTRQNNVGLGLTQHIFTEPAFARQPQQINQLPVSALQADGKPITSSFEHRPDISKHTAFDPVTGEKSFRMKESTFVPQGSSNEALIREDPISHQQWLQFNGKRYDLL